MRLAGTGVLAAAAAPLLGCAGDSVAAEGGAGQFGAAESPLTGYKPKAIATDEPLNTFEDITTYNNFYEFGTGQGRPGSATPASLKTKPWTVKVDGLVKQAGRLPPRRSDQAARSSRSASIACAASKRGRW